MPSKNKKPVVKSSLKTSKANEQDKGIAIADETRDVKVENVEVKPTTTLAEVITIDGAYEELAKLGVPCIVCPLMGMEMHFLTLEAIAKMYNLDLERILKKLNDLLRKTSSVRKR